MLASQGRGGFTQTPLSKLGEFGDTDLEAPDLEGKQPDAVTIAGEMERSRGYENGTWMRKDVHGCFDKSKSWANRSWELG
jgi:hypothetical protein